MMLLSHLSDYNRKYFETEIVIIRARSALVDRGIPFVSCGLLSMRPYRNGWARLGRWALNR